MREQVRRVDARHNSARVARAAIAVLSEKGPAASLDDIARRAGIGIATVYRRFGDRDGVIRAALSAYVAETVEPRLRGARDGGDAGRALTEALAATVALLAARHGLLAAAKECGAFDVDVAERFMEPLRPLLTRAQRQGRVRADLVVRDLAAIVVMTLATVPPGGSAAADTRRSLALLLAGLRPSAEPLPAAGRAS
ncbi:TetR/AcrR family transcriptional regulator [Nonomuraea aridisoli]|uniref:TetR/AcrR family transcriptional regulator n=1 Tax=Nonomuraea aridisoli TaxID=2070368 RepID=A0A2W2EDS6_9ACTN|nr:TetR/AcrR family transcriptional regulator [Nonomuraea aridisoli]PZG02904.1 TetR/AcrR family transcriptional regulator [Nonomuraea aridisoli]